MGFHCSKQMLGHYLMSTVIAVVFEEIKNNFKTNEPKNKNKIKKQNKTCLSPSLWVDNGS